MPKNKSRSLEEYYRGLLREKDKEIRQLKRRIKELEKYDRDVEITHEVLKEHEAHIKRLAELEANNYKELCPQCFKGKLELKLSVRNKDYYECNNCNYRINKPSRG